MPWRFKPVTSRRLLYLGVGRQVLQSQNVAEQQIPSFAILQMSISLDISSLSVACRMVGLEGVTRRLYWLKANGL